MAGSLKYGSIIEGSTEYCEGKKAVVVFLGGCPFRCGYCYSGPIVVAAENCLEMTVEAMLEYLGRKKAENDAVVFTGAEPLQQYEPLAELCGELKRKGWFVRIETNGFYADSLDRILPVVSEVALDVKTELDADKYAKITGFRGEPATLMQETFRSIVILKNAKQKSPGLTVELRTTIIPGVNDSVEGVEKISAESSFADKYVLQQFVAEGMLIDQEYKKFGGTPKQTLIDLAEAAMRHCKNVFIRTQEDGEQKVELQDGAGNQKVEKPQAGGHGQE